jgi:hypothetical protein
MAEIDVKQIHRFLEQLQRQLEGGAIMFEGRPKNIQALEDLDINPSERKNYLKQLQLENFSSGPNPDEVHKGCSLWEFGMLVKGLEVYIKITQKDAATDLYCISFHLAEYPMTYPLKNN